MDAFNEHNQGSRELRPTETKGGISLDVLLEQIDLCLNSGLLKEAARFLAKAERMAASEPERMCVVDRLLLHGTLGGYFDSTEKLFTEQQLRHPEDKDLEVSHKIFRHIAGWDQTVLANEEIEGTVLASEIHKKLLQLLDSIAPLPLIESLAALSWQGRAEMFLPNEIASWADLEDVISHIGERVLPYPLEALLGEAWFSDPSRGDYARLSQLRNILPETKNVPAFADVVAYLSILQDVSRRELSSALDNLTALMAGHSAWLWLRIVDLSAYFGQPQQWKKVCLWLQKQERQQITLQLHPLLHAFADIVVSASANGKSPLSSRQMELLVQQIGLEPNIKIIFWQAQPATNAVVRNLLHECVSREDVPSSWTDLIYPSIRAGLNSLRAAQKRDVVSVQSAWSQLPEKLRERPEIQQTVQQVAVSMVGKDAPTMTPEFWLNVLPLWVAGQPDALIPVLNQLTQSPERDWLLSHCIVSLAKSNQGDCRRWLKKRREDFTEIGWSNLSETLGRLDPLWKQELEELTLSQQTKQLLHEFDKKIESKKIGEYELKGFREKVPARERFLSPVFRRLAQLLCPPLFVPTSFEHWYSVFALRQYWADAMSAERQSALNTLDDSSRPLIHRLLDEPLRPLLIDVANITLNEQIIGQGTGNPFAALERIWAASWIQGFYPILTYADASFWQNYKAGMEQLHFDRLCLDHRIQVAANTGDHRSKADFDILLALDEQNWQQCASMLTRDNFAKKKDIWVDMFPWLQNSYRNLRMEFNVSSAGQLILTPANGQRFEVP